MIIRFNVGWARQSVAEDAWSFLGAAHSVE